MRDGREKRKSCNSININGFTSFSFSPCAGLGVRLFFFLLATGRAGIGSSLKKAGKKKLNQQRKRENEKS